MEPLILLFVNLDSCKQILVISVINLEKKNFIVIVAIPKLL